MVPSAIGMRVEPSDIRTATTGSGRLAAPTGVASLINVAAMMSVASRWAMDLRLIFI